MFTKFNSRATIWTFSAINFTLNHFETRLIFRRVGVGVLRKFLKIYSYRTAHTARIGGESRVWKPFNFLAIVFSRFPPSTIDVRSRKTLSCFDYRPHRVWAPQSLVWVSFSSKGRFFSFSPSSGKVVGFRDNAASKERHGWRHLTNTFSNCHCLFVNKH